MLCGGLVQERRKQPFLQRRDGIYAVRLFELRFRMEVFMKKIWGLLTVAIAAVLLVANGYCTRADASSGFDDLSKSEIVDAMGAGWNLGNQLEASTDSGQGETLWGNPTITASALQSVKAAGFNTVRIPVSWLYKIGSSPDYTIDSTWLDRVQQVVDYAIANDMYVLLDLHNDGSISVNGSWILTNSSNQEEIRTKLGKVWTQIATRFKNYDEHLIFESMNEIGAESGSSETEIRNAITLINGYNQVFVDAVRQTGGNNTKRWLMIPGWSTNIQYTVGDYGFAIPNDTYLSSDIASGQKRIMISVHYYTPWEFAGQTDDEYTTWGEAESNTITWANETYMKDQIKSLYDTFYTAGYPVVIGEYGSIDKESLDSNNANSRAYYARSVCKYSKQYHCVPVYWDNGSNGLYGMALFNRHNSYAVTQPLILSAIMYYYGSAVSTEIAVQNKNVSMELGDSPVSVATTLTPSTATEWIEYESANESVASVDRFGKITAKGVGSTTITASVNGHSDTCNVTVTAPEYTRVKLYMQNSSNWTTTESDSFVSISDNGSYTISITGTRSEMSNITLLYLQDIGSYLGANATSKISSANIQINHVKFNGTSCNLSSNSCSISGSDSFYIGFINTWATSLIQNISKDSSSDGNAFTNVTYADTNTIEIKFTVSNAVFTSSGGNSGGSEQTIFDGSTSAYSSDDASWLLEAEDTDVITMKYHAADSSQAGWGIAGWGATVGGEWVNGPVYSADSSNPTATKTATVTAGSLKTALGITSGSTVSYITLMPYNSGVIESITLQSS